MPPASKNKTNLGTETPVPIQQGEKTGKQSPQAGMTLGSVFDSLLIRPGTFKTYREMRENPTIALARAVANAPIQTASISTTADDDVPDNVKTFADAQVDILWPGYSQDVLYARDYGFQAWEKVWGVDTVDGAMRWVIRKLKALTPDITRPVVNMDTGIFEGIRQKAIVLEVPYSLWVTYDAEPGQWFGRSQHENIRKHAWMPWLNTAAKQRKYMGKVAGVIPTVHYPVGEGRDATGKTVSNFDIAQTVLASLGNGHGVAIPSELASWAQDLAQAGVDVEKMISWRISFLETKGQHGKEFIETLRHYESLMMRGWLVPERAATEGQYGTKAEATTHASIALVIAGLILNDFIRCFNWYVLNPLLVYNFGQQAENTVRVQREGLDPAQELFWRETIKAVLTNPNNTDLFQTWLDVEAMLDLTGLPVNPDGVAKVEPDERSPIPPDVAGGQPVDSTAGIAAALSRLQYRVDNGSTDAKSQ